MIAHSQIAKDIVLHQSVIAGRADHSTPMTGDTAALKGGRQLGCLSLGVLAATTAPTKCRTSARFRPIQALKIVLHVIAEVVIMIVLLCRPS